MLVPGASKVDVEILEDIIFVVCKVPAVTFVADAFVAVAFVVDTFVAKIVPTVWVTKRASVT